MTQVLELDERLQAALEAYRKDHEGREPEVVLREALEAFLREQGYLKRQRPKSVGMGRSGRPDLAEHDEELLWADR